MPRFLPTEFASVKGLRLAAGPEVTLVNASRGGMLIESQCPLAPNESLLLRLVTREAAYLLKGRVLRSRVHSLAANAVLYRIAVVFDEEFSELGSDGKLSLPQRPMPENVIELPLARPGGVTRTHEFAKEAGSPLLALTMSAKRFDSLIDRVFGATDT